jgi:very-short-patch-repair endonuclease
MYMSDKCTVEDIAKHFKCSKSHILKQARIMGIKKTPCINHGIGKIWKKDEQEYVINAVKEQMSHSGKKGVSLLEIAEHINVSVLALVKFLKDNNILCHENGEYIIPSTQEFQDDFKNPFISNRALALKYKMSEASFSKARRQIFGSGWKTKRNTWFYRSTAEIKFEEILSNLHFSFIPQQEINGWRYDYDLGFFLLVEVQGTYWHSTDSVRDNDEKKRLSAEKMGYEVVQIAECDLDNDPGSVQKYIFRKMQDKVKQYYGFPKTL